MITNKELLSILRRFPRNAKVSISNQDAASAPFENFSVRAQLDEQGRWQIIFEVNHHHPSNSETKN